MTTEAHCRRCAHHKHIYSPMPGESHERCMAAKCADGTAEYCSRNRGNACPDFKLAWWTPRRFAPVGKWWEPYM